jgi:hypothetical protein
MFVNRAPGGGQRCGEMLGAAVGLRRDVEQAVAGAERAEGPAGTPRGEPIGEPGSGVELWELAWARRSVAHPDGEGVRGDRLEDRRLEAPTGGGADGVGRNNADKLNGGSAGRPDEHARRRRREALQGGDHLGQGEVAQGSSTSRTTESQIKVFRS